MKDKLDKIFVKEHPKEVYVNKEIIRLTRENMDLKKKLIETREYLRLVRMELGKIT